jgi:hypothetical protein
MRSAAGRPASKGVPHARKPWWAKVDPSADSLQNVKDPIIDALPQEARATIAAIWQNRGGLELRVAAAFSVLTNELLEHGTVPAALEIVSRAVRDEVHHAQISIDLAARYRGDAPIWPPPEPVHVPEFAPASPRLRSTLHAIALSCINETVACSILERSIAQAKSPIVRAGLQSILTDEIDHARAGWAHLASGYVTREMRGVLGGWVHRMVTSKLHELVEEHTPLPGEEFPDHGFLSRQASREIVGATLLEAIFPGFEQTGMDIGETRTWHARAFG